MNERNDLAFGQREEEIFAQAVDIASAEERAKFLEEACGSDAQLRASLNKWISEYEQPDEIFADPNSVLSKLCANKNHPKRFGEFQLIREIGRGGMGIVYEARQTSLNRRVALKVLSVGLSLSKSGLVRFQREAEAAARLHHTNIVPVYTTGIQDGIPYYAMEFVEGPSLEKVLSQIRVDSLSSDHLHTGAHNSNDDSSGREEEERPAITTVVQANAETLTANSSFGRGSKYFDNIAEAMADVAAALDHAHTHGIIHRDIKPSNLLLSPEGRVIINDFGVARVVEEPGLTVTGELMGSPRYMSPEQMSSRHGALDHRTDVYSLGVTLYEMLTLRPAFRGDDNAKVLHQVSHKEPKSPRRINSRIPVDLETICLKAMDKNPAQRYQSAQAMSDDLRRFVNRYQISARRVGPLGQAVRWCRRNPTVAALAAMLVLVVAAAFTGLVGLHLKQERAFAKELAVIDPVLVAHNPMSALRGIHRLRTEYGNRRELDELYAAIGQEVTIESDATDATIFVRPMDSPDSDWLQLGTLSVVPLEVRLPRGNFLGRVTRPGGEDHVFGLSHWEDSRFWIPIPAHPGMVRHSPTTLWWMRIPWRRMQEFPDLTEYSMDRFEVRNVEFKRFVDDGGYHRRRFWAESLGEDSWKDVVSTFVDKTNMPGPKSWENGRYPEGMQDHPVVGVSWYEAMAYAKWAGKQLPTVYHWLGAADFSGQYLPVDVLSRSNIGKRDAGPRANREPYTYTSVTTSGTFDMAGNVKEWCLNEEADSRRFAMGGSWQDDVDAMHEPFAVSPHARQDDIGFRCAIYDVSDQLTRPMPIEWRVFSDVQDTLPPLEDCKKLFDYQKDKPWHAELHERVSIDGINYQVFQIDTVNDQNDRMNIYVAYPADERYSPPYETVIVAANVNPVSDTKQPIFESALIDKLLSRGRAVVMPILFGMGERRDLENFPIAHPSPDKVDAYGITMVNIAKDYSRTVDFVERFDQATGNASVFDTDRMAFCGFGWGGCQGPTLLVADYLTHNETWRVKAAVLTDAGLVQCLQPPRIDQMTYLPHLKVPTMMLNCRLMVRSPYHRAQRPMFELLPLNEDTEKVLTSLPKSTWVIPDVDFDEYANRWLDAKLSKREWPKQDSLDTN